MASQEESSSMCKTCSIQDEEGPCDNSSMFEVCSTQDDQGACDIELPRNFKSENVLLAKRIYPKFITMYPTRKNLRKQYMVVFPSVGSFKRNEIISSKIGSTRFKRQKLDSR